MTNKRLAWVPGVSFAVWALALAAAARPAPAGAADAVPYSTPPGVTLVDVYEIISNALPQYLWRRLGDEHGKPLYTYDKDPVGQSTCLGACATEFTPFLADARARASGDFSHDWSLITRPDHTRQWAYQGKALYRYTGEDPSGEPVGDREVVVNPAWRDPASKFYSPKAGWRRAAFTPLRTVALPAGIALDNMAVASGFGLVDAATGMTIYAIAPSRKLSREWKPVYAPALALPVGPFSIVSRTEDGTHQWALRGQRLYTYSGDYASGEINGMFADKNVAVALIYRNFMPSSMRIGRYIGRGPLLTTRPGRSVYTEARYHLQYGGRETRTGYFESYNNAKSLGPQGCLNTCLKTWQPVAADRAAQSWGFWEVVTRPDGSRQWAFKGSPLYTYSGDKRPGDIEGNNRHDIVYGGAHGTLAYGDPYTNVSMRVAAGGSGDDADAGAGFYWHLATLLY
jgi:predicted lipoprotein with Yx(FWY)xxD motif